MQLAGARRYRLRGSGSELSLDQRIAPGGQIYEIHVRGCQRFIPESRQRVVPARKAQIEYVAKSLGILAGDAVVRLCLAHGLQQGHLWLAAQVMPGADPHSARTR